MTTLDGNPHSLPGDERRRERRSPAGSRPKTLRERQLRKERALRIVGRYGVLAGAVGLVPAHFFGQLAVAGLLGKMFHDLCRLYGTDLADQKVKSLIAAVLGGAHSDWIAGYLAKYADKAFPGTLGLSLAVTRPLAAGAITYAVGMLFVHHLDTGAWTRKPRRLESRPSIG